MKKKILYLRTDIYKKKIIAGGSVTHTLGVIRGFIDMNYSVFCASSVMHDQLSHVGIKKIISLKMPKILGFLRWKLNCFFSNIFFTLQVLMCWSKIRPDYIYQRYSILNCTGIILSKLKKTIFILEYNGSEVWINKNWGKKRIINFSFLVAFIERININYAHFIVVVSDVLKDELISRGVDEKKILVNPNAVDYNVYNPVLLQLNRIDIRKKLEIEDTFVFGFIGTFSIWHGVEVFENIIPKLVLECRKVHFIFIGDGPLKKTLELYLEKLELGAHCTFTGILPAEEARSYLAACDAFFCPTNKNIDGTPFFGSPTKMFEYMSMAKPIIAFDLGQISMLMKPVTESKKEFLISPGDVDGFYYAAKSVVNMSLDERECIGNILRSEVKNKYSWIMHTKRIVSLVEKVVCE